MDDSIDSVENDEEGVELYRQLKALWGAANMQARKWISNSPEVMEKIPAEERATEIVIDSGQDPITKTLGISWNSTKDEFTVTASPVSPGFQTTKQNSNYFRPTGICLPVRCCRQDPTSGAVDARILLGRRSTGRNSK